MGRGPINLGSFSAGDVGSLATILPLAGGGGHPSATYLVDITTIGSGDTWTVDVRWKNDDGNSISVAEGANQTATGLSRPVLTSDFAATRMAIPAINEIFFTRVVDGGGPSEITATLYAVYGD